MSKYIYIRYREIANVEYLLRVLAIQYYNLFQNSHLIVSNIVTLGKPSPQISKYKVSSILPHSLALNRDILHLPTSTTSHVRINT